VISIIALLGSRSKLHVYMRFAGNLLPTTGDHKSNTETSGATSLRYFTTCTPWLRARFCLHYPGRWRW